MGGSAAVGLDQDTCIYVPDWAHMEAEQMFATACNVIIAIIGLASLIYYAGGCGDYVSGYLNWPMGSNVCVMRPGVSFV